MTGSVASAPDTALRAAAAASMGAMGFMDASVALTSTNFNHEIRLAIR
jgi:hypothetical protein